MLISSFFASYIHLHWRRLADVFDDIPHHVSWFVYQQFLLLFLCTNTPQVHLHVLSQIRLVGERFLAHFAGAPRSRCRWAGGRVRSACEVGAER